MCVAKKTVPAMNLLCMDLLLRHFSQNASAEVAFSVMENCRLCVICSC